MEFLRFRPQWFRETGSGALDTELSPDSNFMLHEVRLSLEDAAVPGTGDFNISLESGEGTAFNTILDGTDMEDSDSHIFRPTVEQRILFEEGDTIKFEWDNGGATARAFGLEVIWSPIH